MSELSEATVVVASQGQVSATLQRDAVILDTARGIYYGINEVAARMWDLVQQPITVRALTDAITGEYEVDRERCYADVVRLIGDLEARGLIEVEG